LFNGSRCYVLVKVQKRSQIRRSAFEFTENMAFVEFRGYATLHIFHGRHPISRNVAHA